MTNRDQSGETEAAETSAASAAMMELDRDSDVDLSDFRWTDIPGLIAFWSLAIIVFLQFFTRYVLNDSLAWTEEVARYVLIVVAFSGAITVSRKGTHIFLEFFYRFIPPMAGKILSVLVEVCNVAFWGYLVWLGIQLSNKTKTKMASIAFPKSIVYWTVTVCIAVMALYALFWVVKKIRQTPDQILQEIEEHAISE